MKVLNHLNTSDNGLAPALNYIGTKTRVKFVGSCLKEDKITFIHGKIVNIYIFCKIRFSARGYDDYPILENSLFGAFDLVTNADIDKYKYSGYGITFDRRETFSFPTGGSGYKVIIFGVYMSSSVHVDNKKKYFLILGQDPTQELDDTTLTTEKKCLINFTESRKKFCLSLH